jgi:hypothetical protein
MTRTTQTRPAPPLAVKIREFGEVFAICVSGPD